jgi:hypothetical protein
MKMLRAILLSIAAILILTSNAKAGSFLQFSIGDYGHHSGTSVGFSINVNDNHSNYSYSARSYGGGRYNSHNRYYSTPTRQYRGHSHYWNAYNGRDRHHHKSHLKRSHHNSRHNAYNSHGRHGDNRGHNGNGHNRGHNGNGHHNGYGHK